MNDTTTTTKTRERQFSRLYDYVKGAVSIKRTTDGTTAVLSIESIPPTMRDAFALGAYADYITNLGNKAAKEGADPFDVMAKAAGKVEAGQLDFRTGESAGADIGVCMLVGRALFELGKKAVTFKGVRYPFDTQDMAADAMRTLYDDADDKVKDPTTRLTGRQFFTQIKADAKVAEKLQSYKPKAVAHLDAAFE